MVLSEEGMLGKNIKDKNKGKNKGKNTQENTQENTQDTVTKIIGHMSY